MFKKKRNPNFPPLTEMNTITYPKLDYTKINNENISNENIIYHQSMLPRKYNQFAVDELKQLHSLLNLPQNAIYGPSIMNFNGVFYISTYPIEFIEEDESLKIGCYYCMTCAKHGCYNSVFIGLCTSCAKHPELKNKRGSGFHFSGVELNPLNENSACNTYLKFIRFDMIGCRYLRDTDDEIASSPGLSKDYIEFRKLLQQTGQLVSFSLHADAIAMYTLYNLDKSFYEEEINDADEPDIDEEDIKIQEELLYTDETNSVSSSSSEPEKEPIITNRFSPVELIFQLLIQIIQLCTMTLKNKLYVDLSGIPALEPIEAEAEAEEGLEEEIDMNDLDDTWLFHSPEYDGFDGYDNN